LALSKWAFNKMPKNASKEHINNTIKPNSVYRGFNNNNTSITIHVNTDKWLDMSILNNKNKGGVHNKRSKI
jgi:hypothetical protein